MGAINTNTTREILPCNSCPANAIEGRVIALGAGYGESAAAAFYARAKTLPTPELAIICLDCQHRPGQCEAPGCTMDAGGYGRNPHLCGNCAYDARWGTPGPRGSLGQPYFQEVD